MIDFPLLLRKLHEGGVEFIIIGGVAAVVHGSSYLTQDLDIVYERSDSNITRLVEALDEFQPYLRDVPPGLPFKWSAMTVRRGLNFTLTSTAGPIDIFGEIEGGGTYADLLPHTLEIEAFGVICLCIDRPALIRAKRAAGRPKDLVVIAELEALAGNTE